MSIYDIVVFVAIWAISDRLREIAVFDNWHSRFGEGWFDRYFTADTPTWWPFRDGYHFFKFVAIAALVWWVGHRYDWWQALAVYAVWSVGQWIGLVFRKEDV